VLIANDLPSRFLAKGCDDGEVNVAVTHTHAYLWHELGTVRAAFYSQCVVEE
jgi:hypothetical protein